MNPQNETTNWSAISFQKENLSTHTPRGTSAWWWTTSDARLLISDQEMEIIELNKEIDAYCQAFDELQDELSIRI